MAFTVTLLVVLALREFTAITSAEGDAGWDAVAVAVGAGLPFVFYLNRPDLILSYLFLAPFVFFAARMFSGGAISVSVSWVAARVLGVIYIALPLSHFILIGDAENGRLWILFLFAVVWSNDTMAYVVGKTLGSRALAPSISPGKTVEGALGGWIGGVVAAYLFNRFSGIGMAGGGVIFIAVTLGAVSLLGDLFESMLKRGAGVKDSGNLIPGHGGVLDRIDGVIFSVPVLYYYILWRGMV